MPIKRSDQAPPAEPFGALAAPVHPPTALVVRLAAAALAAYTAIVHAVLGLQDLGILGGTHHHDDLDGHGHATYIAAAFVVGAVLLVAAAWLLATSDHTLGWALGGLVCAGMIAALLVSRETTWMPAGFHQHGYDTDALGCLAAETGFLVLFAARTVRRAQPLEGGDR